MFARNRLVLTSSRFVNSIARRSLAQPVTRVKGTTYRGGDEPPTEQPPGFDFDSEVKKIIKAVADSVQPLIPMNENFSVELISPEELVIHTNRGKYKFHPDHQKQVLTLQSYFSGFHNYFFDPTARRWLSVKDGHDLVGLFIRDVMRHHAGCPSL